MTKKFQTHGYKLPKTPFMGEMMICKDCGKRQKSDPTIESGWTVLEVDGKFYYFCPTCFGKMIGTK